MAEGEVFLFFDPLSPFHGVIIHVTSPLALRDGVRPRTGLFQASVGRIGLVLCRESDDHADPRHARVTQRTLDPGDRRNRSRPKPFYNLRVLLPTGLSRG